MTTTAERLAPLTALDTQGRPVVLGDLWRERPVVLAFVRHFGWMFCKQQVAQLRGIADRVHEKGAEIVVIGNGSVEAARRFAGEQQVSFPLLTDPSRRTYQAAGLKHGLMTTLRPSVLSAGAGAMKEGFRQSATEGDPFQQGGAFVFDRGGGERLAFVSEAAGAHLDPEALVAALP